jgi:hypothetical protein
MAATPDSTEAGHSLGVHEHGGGHDADHDHEKDHDHDTHGHRS